jgi:hypothetical protein
MFGREHKIAQLSAGLRAMLAVKLRSDLEFVKERSQRGHVTSF